MKKLIVSIIVIGLLLTTSIATVNAFDKGELSEELEVGGPWIPIPYADIYVDDDAPPEWYDETHVKTITEGINNASEGDTIFVFNGTYNEWLRFSKSVKLIGEDKESTIIIRKYSFEVSDVEGLKLSGFTIKGGLGGIHMYRCYNCTISGNIVTNIGIRVSNSSYNTIKDNIITDTDGDGIHTCYHSKYNIISGNYIANCSDDGIDLGANSNYNTVTGNTITNSDNGVLIFGSTSQYNTISGNTITNSRMNGVAVASDGIHGNNVITGNTITNGDLNGIKVSASNNNVITDNTITHNGIWGISVVFSNNNVITDNIITDNNDDGIYLYDSSNNVITGNTIADNSYYGIWLNEVSNNIVKSNTITGNQVGILIVGRSLFNILSKNLITNNEVALILYGYIAPDAPPGQKMHIPSGNKIIANNITDNTEYGIHANSLTLGNHVYYNNFINNNQNARDTGTNIWYKFNLAGSKGNYWDDYTGEDADGDGIGDTPYDIPPYPFRNKDRYPRMDPIDIENVEANMEMTNDMANEESEELLQEQLNSQYNAETSISTYINDIINLDARIGSTPSSQQSTPTSTPSNSPTSR